jgi:hypothetical protein
MLTVFGEKSLPSLRGRGTPVRGSGDTGALGDDPGAYQAEVGSMLGRVPRVAVSAP